MQVHRSFLHFKGIDFSAFPSLLLGSFSVESVFFSQKFSSFFFLIFKQFFHRNSFPFLQNYPSVVRNSPGPFNERSRCNCIDWAHTPQKGLEFIPLDVVQFHVRVFIFWRNIWDYVSFLCLHWKWRVNFGSFWVIFVHFHSFRFISPTDCVSVCVEPVFHSSENETVPKWIVLETRWKMGNIELSGFPAARLQTWYRITAVTERNVMRDKENPLVTWMWMGIRMKMEK